MKVVTVTKADIDAKLKAIGYDAYAEEAKMARLVEEGPCYCETSITGWCGYCRNHGIPRKEGATMKDNDCPSCHRPIKQYKNGKFYKHVGLFKHQWCSGKAEPPKKKPPQTLPKTFLQWEEKWRDVSEVARNGYAQHLTIQTLMNSKPLDVFFTASRDTLIVVVNKGDELEVYDCIVRRKAVVKR